MADPEWGDALATPPLDPDFFSDLFSSDDIHFSSDDFSLLDLLIPDVDSLSSGPLHHPADVVDLCSDSRVSADVAGYTNASSNPRVSDDVADYMNVSSDPRVSDDVAGCLNASPDSRVSDDVAGYMNVTSDSRVSDDVTGFLNVSSPEENSRVFADVAGVNCSPGNSGNSVNFVKSNNSPNSVLSNDSSKGGVKSEEESNKLALKRKKNVESEIKTSKQWRPNYEDQTVITNEDEKKKKARLERNRESAQLSRQRKKHYLEELEEKVKLMQSTIHDLNTKISYVMAENASLRMQANGTPPPGMYPPMYPWAPYPPYMVKGSSQVPLVPIPRLKVKPQNFLSKVKKSESESKSKTKKVASVSLLGLLFFVLLFGGLVPMVNLKFSEMDKSVLGNGQFLSSVNVNGSDTKIGISNGFGSNGEFGNSSKPLFASLYVPRNDKLVKIDGNLIIQSVMASERRSEETSLAVARNNVPNIIPLTGRNRYPHPYRGERQRALGGEKDKLISSSVDGNNDLQEWFIDGLAGPMLSSGMCTEVFQFDVSPGAIVPATTFTNVSSESQHLKNVTAKHGKVNRRILHGAPVPLESNITEKPMGIDSEKDKLRGNSSLSSMVVSVLVDPREVGDGGGDGMMGPKSLSRIFVVVLIDSVKYVTYSCMLPLRGSSAHLVTT